MWNKSQHEHKAV